MAAHDIANIWQKNNTILSITTPDHWQMFISNIIVLLNPGIKTEAHKIHWI